MATLTVFGNTSDDSIQSANSTYATARSGGTLTVVGINVMYVGQQHPLPTDYECHESFVSFTNSLSSQDTITAVAFSLFGQSDITTTDFTLNLRNRNWGTTVTTADWFNVYTDTLLATYATSGGWSTSAYNNFTSQSGFNSGTGITKGGTNYWTLSSDRQESATTPTTLEKVGIHSADAAGTTNDPKLVITYTPPSAAISGTATASINEADIVAGNKTVIITLTSTEWVTAGASFDGQRQNIINGMDSAQAEAAGWDAVVKAGLAVGTVVRTSNTVVTVTLSAFASYNITATETVTVTVPSTATTYGSGIIATPTFTVAAFTITTVTPGTLTKTLSAQAPNLKFGYTPGVLANTLAAFAPSLKLALQLPAPLALTTALFAPSAVVGTAVTPGNGTLALAAFAPSLAEALNLPAPLATALTGLAPSAYMVTPVTPPAGALVLAAFAPLLTFGYIPGALAAALTGYAPQLHESLTPSSAALLLAGFAPSLHESLTPSSAALALTGYPPVDVYTPGTLALSLSGFAPSLIDIINLPAPATLTLTAYVVETLVGGHNVVLYAATIAWREPISTLALPSYDALLPFIHYDRKWNLP